MIAADVADIPRQPDRPTTVVHLITTLTQGGAERVLSQVVPRPDQHADERHIVISLVPGGMFSDELVTAGVEVRDLGMRPGRDVVRGTLRLAAALRELEPTMVISWMYHASLLDLLARPFADRARRAWMVWVLRGSLHSLAGLPWHTRATVRLLARRSHRPDAVAINSRAGRRHHTVAGYRPRNWILLPNGCDTTHFRPDPDDRRAVRAELGIAPDTLVAVTVARHHPQKDHATLLAALGTARAAVNDLELILVGSGTQTLARPDGAGLRVHGLGERRDVARLLRAADLIISSSLTEGLPNALLEGMSTGLVPIVTDVGDCRDVVGDTGEVVAPSDVDGLSRAVERIARLPRAELDESARRARDRVIGRFDAGLAEREYRALWDAETARSLLQDGRDSTPIHIAHIIARMNVGGPASILSGLLDELDPIRFPQVLISGEVGPGEEDWYRVREPDRAEDERIIRIASLGRAIAPLRDLRTVRTLTRALKDLAPDVVQTHTAKAGLLGRIAARRAGVPHIVHTFHGHTLHGYFPRAVSRLFTWLERRSARRTHHLLAVGTRVRDELLDAGIGSAQQYVVLPPGTSFGETPDRAASRESLGITDDAAPVVAFVGRLSRVKRPDRFLEAAATVAKNHPETIFLVVGDGELRSELETQMQHPDRPGPDVRLLGWRGDVDAVYAAADIVVLTSDNEGMPVTLIEASAAGCACVTTDVGSADEVVLHDRTGLVVPCDAAAIAAAVDQLLADPARREAFGTAARTHARETFSMVALADRLAEVYQHGPLATRG